MLMLARKFSNYRLHTAPKQAEMPFFIVVPQDRKNFNQISSKERKFKKYINN